MSLVNQSTAQLRKMKEDMDSAASFAALHSEVGESMGAELRGICTELEARAQAYRQYCRDHTLASIVDDWFLLGSGKKASEVVDALALGWLPGARSDEILLNPRNLYFDEIIITFNRSADLSNLDRNQIASASFTMRHPVEHQWLESRFGKERMTLALSSETLQLFSIGIAHGEIPVRMDLAVCPSATGQGLLRYAVIFPE